MTKHFYKLITVTFLFAALLSNDITVYSQDKLIECKATIPLPEGSPSAGEIRFAAVGDTGRGNSGQRQVAQAMENIQARTKFNLLLFLGDNVYNSGELKDFKEKLYEPYQKLKDERGVMIRGVLGNHDIEGEDKNGIKAQQQYFQMCAESSVTCDNTFYSFSVGNVDFFALDSNTLVRYKPNFLYTTKTRQNQIDWLTTELPKSKEKNNWQIVFLHHIFYSSSDGHGIYASDEKNTRHRNEIRDVFPILNNSKVDLVLSGHDHFYERIDAQKANPQGNFTYFINGAGAKKNSALRTSPFQVCGNDEKLSFMLFSVKSDTLTFWAIDSSGRAFDSGTIQRK